MDNVVQEARDIVDRDLDKQLTFIEVWWVGKYGSEAQRATLKDRKLRYADNLIGTGLPDDNFKSYDSSQLRYPKGHKLGGQWRLSGGSERTYVEGRELDTDDLPDLADKIQQNRKSYDSKDPDFVLEYLVEVQGFDGKPEVVSPEDVAELVADGDVEIHRGMSSYMDDDNFLRQYRDAEMFLGKGMYGNGVYTTTDRLEARDVYANGEDNRVLSMLLRSDAKVATPKDLDNISRNAFANLAAEKDILFERAFKAYQTGGNDAAEKVMNERDALQAAFDPFKDISSDEGRLTAFLGYDAIKIELARDETFYVIVNRTATRVIDNEVFDVR